MFKKLMVSALFLPVLLIVPLSSSAGELKVTWQEPESYTDVRGADISDKRFQQRVFGLFEKHFNKLSQQLPEDVSLALTFTNVNLAGDVRYSFSMHREIRLVKSIYWPMLAFNYSLTRDGEVIASGEEKLKDMAFLDRGQLRKGSSTIKYEKRLFDKWFNNEIVKKLEVLSKQHSAVMAAE